MKSASRHNDNELVRESERRRPGITGLANRIKAGNPSWSDARVANQAKVEYTRSTGTAKR